MPISPEVFARLKKDFVMAEASCSLADGRAARLHYLDSAASTLALRSAQHVTNELLMHYANPHSQAHFAARSAAHALDWAHRQVLHFFGLTDAHRYVTCFAGSGSTALFNRLARILRRQNPHRDIVLISMMEHHANDLPHRRYARQVLRIPLTGTAPMLRVTDLTALERLFNQYPDRIRYVAITSASNVTGIVNPIYDIAALAHAYGAWIIVDACQHVAHAPLPLSDTGSAERELDAIVFSGHKLYAPGSPGVLVARRALLENQEPDELGGGMVDWVTFTDYRITERFPEREEAGTPNIPGAVQLGAALYLLRQAGMATIHAAEQRLTQRLLEKLTSFPGVRLYGDPDWVRTPRVGVISFNLAQLEHGLVAAALNDYYHVAVRNGCFCAHPYVRELLKPELWALAIDPDGGDAEQYIDRWRGMVRASLGLYSTDEDIDALLDGVRDLLTRPDFFRAQYWTDGTGNFWHRTFQTPPEVWFDPEALLTRWLEDSDPASTCYD